jgi:AcrR family transcriptional regulator
LRADARRNRDRLLVVAAKAVAADGANTSLEQIARTAGVGVGTLYRHFPSREALIIAIYRREVDQLTGSVDRLLAEHPPDEALRVWMDGFVRYTATKRGMGEALHAAMAANSDVSPNVRARLLDALDRLIAASVNTGTVRADVTGETVLLALGAIWLLPDGPDRDTQAARLLDLLMDGLRAPTRAAPTP